MKPRGDIAVDAGAALALRQAKSLLPAGVTAVYGQVGRGDSVTIHGPDAVQIGAGLARYSSDEARIIAGQRSDQIAVVLGYPGRAALIHRDDMSI